MQGWSPPRGQLLRTARSRNFRPTTWATSSWPTFCWTGSGPPRGGPGSSTSPASATGNFNLTKSQGISKGIFFSYEIQSTRAVMSFPWDDLTMSQPPYIGFQVIIINDQYYVHTCIDSKRIWKLLFMPGVRSDQVGQHLVHSGAVPEVTGVRGERVLCPPWGSQHWPGQIHRRWEKSWSEWHQHLVHSTCPGVCQSPHGQDELPGHNLPCDGSQVCIDHGIKIKIKGVFRKKCVDIFWC